VKAIHNQKSTTLQIVAHALGLLIVEVPVGDVDGIKPRPVEKLVAIGIEDFLEWARVNARQPQNPRHKLPVGARIIFRPAAVAEVSEAAESTVAGHARGVAEAGKGEFVFLIFIEGFAISAAVSVAAVALLQRKQSACGTEEQGQRQTASQQLRHGRFSAE